VAAVPYDVVSTDEARRLAARNSLSFLRVSRAEIDLPPDTDPYADIVYETAARNFETLKRAAPLVVEDVPSLYFYRLQTGTHRQTGLAACFSLHEYEAHAIKKHERTTPDKEDDRTRHMIALRAQTGLVFLTYRASFDIDASAAHACSADPLYDFAAPDGVRHTVWRLDEEDWDGVMRAFERVPALYIADGHHRVASAARTRGDLAARSSGSNMNAEWDWFLAVAFPDNQTRILPYNRAVENLAGLTPARFLEAVGARLPVRNDAAPLPLKGEVSMYLGGEWYAVGLGPIRSAVEGGSKAILLDVSLLQRGLLEPVLGVKDIRTDRRVTCVGGARGTRELERLVDSGRAAVGFSLAPVSVHELMAVADEGEMMPPKSTWFEPKLRDGLLIHTL
jgi:uncharacterized protein (DUF1015 family)